MTESFPSAYNPASRGGRMVMQPLSGRQAGTKGADPAMGPSILTRQESYPRIVSPPSYSESEASLSQTTPAITAQSLAAAPKRERRASVRFDSNAKGTCQTLSVRQESAWEATVRNISCQGIGILLGRRFEPGAVLTIELSLSTEARKRLLLARVAHATFQAEEKKWLIGCILLSPLSEDELQELL